MSMLMENPKSGTPPVAAPIPERFPGREARGYEVLMAQLGLADLIVGEVDGPLDRATIAQAAGRALARHPGLRSRLRWPGGRAARSRFEFLPADPSRVVVDQVDPDPIEDHYDGPTRWHGMAEREMARRFDLGAGYPFRVVWMPRPGGVGGHLILNAAHTVVDGISLMRLLHEVLRDCALIRAGEAEPDPPAALEPTPAALAQIRGRLRDAMLARFALGYMARRHRSFARRCPFPIHRPLAPGEPVATACLFRAGRPENWQRVRSRCRAEGVTVGGAFAAAIQFASLRFIREQTGRLEARRGRVEFPMSMDYSLRRVIAGADVAQEGIGLFTGISEVGIEVPTTIRFWELARALMSSTRKQLEDGTPVLFHRAAERVGDLGRFLDRRGIDHAATGGAGEAVQISNVGQYPYPAEYGPLRLARIFGGNGATIGGPMFAFWLRSINGHFCYNASAMAPAASRGDADSLFNGVASLMERCGGDEVASATLASYVDG